MAENVEGTQGVVYMKIYYNTFLPRQQKVRERVFFAANRDMDDFFGLVLDAAVPACEERIPQLRPSGR